MKTIAQCLDISPSALLPPAYYGPTNVPARTSALSFEANILILKEETNVLVIVSLDWFFVSEGMRNRIIRRCNGCLQQAQLIIAASHTHTSPNPDITKVGCSPVDPFYVDEVETRVAVGVWEMLTSGDFREGNLRFAVVSCEYTISRRKLILVPRPWGLRRCMKLYPNAKAARDHELRVLRIETIEGKLLAVVWGVSCHPNEWPRLRELSPDYPGVVRLSLRRNLGIDKLPVVFFQGFCGDLRPPALGRWLRREKPAITLAMAACGLVNGPFFAGFSESEYDKWVTGIAECALRGVNKAASTPKIIPTLAARRSSVPLSRIGLSGQTPDITFHSFDFGDKLKVFGISAEICWAYAEMLVRMHPDVVVWPLGYIDTVYGYLPSQDMVPLGGYEVNGYKQIFGVTGNLVPNHDAIICNGFLHSFSN